MSLNRGYPLLASQRGRKEKDLLCASAPMCGPLSFFLSFSPSLFCFPKENNYQNPYQFAYTVGAWCVARDRFVSLKSKIGQFFF